MSNSDPWVKIYILLSEMGTRSSFPGSLSAQFLPMDCYCSVAHFVNFHRSLKDLLFALGKER